MHSNLSHYLLNPPTLRIKHVPTPLFQNKVHSVSFLAGSSADELQKISQMELESRHIGWVSCSIPQSQQNTTTVIKIELKGPDNSLRLRQVKVLGESEGVSQATGLQKSYVEMQQHNCETETLKVFRLLTSQVGRTHFFLNHFKFYVQFFSNSNSPLEFRYLNFGIGILWGLFFLE